MCDNYYFPKGNFAVFLRLFVSASVCIRFNSITTSGQGEKLNNQLIFLFCLTRGAINLHNIFVTLLLPSPFYFIFFSSMFLSLLSLFCHTCLFYVFLCHFYLFMSLLSVYVLLDSFCPYCLFTSLLSIFASFSHISPSSQLPAPRPIMYECAMHIN